MKKIIIMFASLLIGTAAFAQTTDTITNKNKQQPSTTVNTVKTPVKKGTIVNDGINYCCPKCDHCDSKPGKCPIDNIDLIKTGDYYCETCNTTNTKAMKCPKCGKEMKKMEPKNSKKPL